MDTENIPVWAEGFIEMINQECQEKLAKLCVKVEAFGLEFNEFKKSKRLIMSGINDVLDDHIEEVEDREQYVASEIKNLFAKIPGIM